MNTIKGFEFKMPEDEVLLKAFFVSSFTGLAAFAAPVVVPFAVTGMAVSQGLFWSKRLVNSNNDLNDSTNRN